uniref:Ig-like domain-containing protein n=1 Tax=Sinocyclocheilus anshuiensis TaxID=1608454 RepID=A0A671PFA7_9TELE
MILFLFYFSIGVKGQNLESISSVAEVKPGEALSLSCRGSGFTFGSYDMHWVRQQPGKALVWMGRVWSNGQGQDYAKSFEGRIEITRDNSKTMVYLKLSGLTEEDSAVYYCARQAQ